MSKFKVNMRTCVLADASCNRTLELINDSTKLLDSNPRALEVLKEANRCYPINVRSAKLHYLIGLLGRWQQDCLDNGYLEKDRVKYAIYNNRWYRLMDLSFKNTESLYKPELVVK